jgi:hypothetical protein
MKIRFPLTCAGELVGPFQDTGASAAWTVDAAAAEIRLDAADDVAPTDAEVEVEFPVVDVVLDEPELLQAAARPTTLALATITTIVLLIRTVSSFHCNKRRKRRQDCRQNDGAAIIRPLLIRFHISMNACRFDARTRHNSTFVV